MRFAIIGAGNTGHAVAAYLSYFGGECALFTRDKNKANILNLNGILSEGAINGQFPVKASTNLAKAVAGADVIIVMTTADAHRDVAQELKQVISDNQKIIIFNGNWGAFQFMQVLGDDIVAKNLIVSETSAQLFLANSPEPGKVNMTLKEKVLICATDPQKTDQLIELTSQYFPQFVKSNSIIETTMSSTNPVIHVPIVLVNLARVENAQPFKFYGEGVSQTAVKMILGVDSERIKVSNMLGFETMDVLSGINSYWEVKHDNLFDALTKNETYLKSSGPKTLNHRFLTEDVPFGIAPISQVGQLFDVPTPHTDNLLNALQDLLGKDLFDKGIKFTRQDFNKLLRQ